MVSDIDMSEAIDYYKIPRGEKPHGVTSALFSFNSAAFGWDAFLQAEVLLTQPLMIVIGDKPGAFGAYRDGWEIYGRATSKNKHIEIAQGASHYDLYDQPKPVAFALSKVVPFFKDEYECADYLTENSLHHGSRSFTRDDKQRMLAILI